MGQQNCRRKNGSRTFGCRIGSDIVGHSCRAVLHNAVFRILCVEIRKPKNNQDGGCSLSAGFVFDGVCRLGGGAFAALAVFGVFANLNNIAINTQAVDVESIYGRSIMSSFHGIWSFAGFFGGIASTLLVAAHINIVGHFAIVNVFTLLILIASYKYLVAVDVSNSSDKEPSGEKPRGFFSPTPFIIFLGMIAFGSMSCEGTMFDWSVVYFKDVVGAAPDASRIGFIAFMSTMAMGRFVGDSLITKFGAVRVLQCSGIVIASGMMLAVIFPNAVVAAVGFLMVGAGVSSVVPTCYSLAGHSRRMKTGIAIATVSTIGFLGFLMGPPLIGFVSEISNLRCSFSLMALIGLVVTFVAPRLRNRVN